MVKDGLRLINVISEHELDFLSQWQPLSRAEIDRGRQAQAAASFWTKAAVTFRTSSDVDALQLTEYADILEILGTVPESPELDTYCETTGLADEYPDDDVGLGKLLKEKLAIVRRELVIAKANHRASGNGDIFEDEDDEDDGNPGSPTNSDGRRESVFAGHSSEFTKYLRTPVVRYAYKILVGDVLTSYVACMPEEAVSGSEHRSRVPQPPGSATKRKKRDITQAQLDLIETVSKTAASITSRSTRQDTDHPSLMVEKVRTATAEAKMAKVRLFDSLQQQFEAIEKKLPGVSHEGLKQILKDRSELLLAEMAELVAQ